MWVNSILKIFIEKGFMFLKKVFTLLICFFVSCNLFAQTSLLFIKEMPISGHQKEMRQFLKSNGFSHNACGDCFSGVIDGKNVDVILTGKKKEVGTVGIIQKPSTDALWMEYNRFVDNLLNDRYTSRIMVNHLSSASIDKVRVIAYPELYRSVFFLSDVDILASVSIVVMKGELYLLSSFRSFDGWRNK